VQAAVEVARSLPVPFMLTARAENFLHGKRDMDDTIRRLQAFEAAGADVLYAPGLHSLAEIRTVTSALKKPFNLVMGFVDPAITLDQLGAAGVRRVSIGGGLNRVALKAFMDAAKQMRQGNFGFLTSMASIAEVRGAFERPSKP
jgi:2-methylisocitrate lyase-like PEP mutase family enzyme